MSHGRICPRTSKQLWKTYSACQHHQRIGFSTPYPWRSCAVSRILTPLKYLTTQTALSFKHPFFITRAKRRIVNLRSLECDYEMVSVANWYLTLKRDQTAYYGAFQRTEAQRLQSISLRFLLAEGTSVLALSIPLFHLPRSVPVSTLTSWHRDEIGTELKKNMNSGGRHCIIYPFQFFSDLFLTWFNSWTLTWPRRSFHLRQDSLASSPWCNLGSIWIRTYPPCWSHSR